MNYGRTMMPDVVGGAPRLSENVAKKLYTNNKQVLPEAVVIGRTVCTLTLGS
jgi:hypothetical protein